MNISIFASIGCQNLGDELILKNEINIIENKELKLAKINSTVSYNFKVFTYDIKKQFFQKENVKYLEYFPIGIKDKKNFFKNIRNFFCFVKTLIWSDYVFIGGGGIIYDNEVQANKNPLDQWIFRNKFFKFFRKKVIFYAVGINIANSDNLKKVEKIFSKAHKIYVRDSFSFKTLQNLGIKSEIIDDPVFYDNQLNKDTKPQLIKEIEVNNFSLKDLENVDLENKNIGITFRSGYIGKSGNEKIELFLVRELIEFLLSKNSRIFLLPHSINKTDLKSNDLEYYKKIVSNTNFKSKVHIAQTLEEVYDFYKEKKLDLCFAMRLHSMILSEVYEIPFVAFSYSKKTEELVKKIRAKSFIKKLDD